MLITKIPLLDELLALHERAIGDSFRPYRNHAYRVANFCVALSGAHGEQLDKVAIAVAFHDLGIWTAGTFDYLEPSVELARTHLSGGDRASWIPELSAMILEHHKIRRYQGEEHWLVEPFRQADWADVTLGARSFGLDRAVLREAFAVFPDAGFRKGLMKLSLRQVWSLHQNPVPMLRW